MTAAPAEFGALVEPRFPPLLAGFAVSADLDPFDAAIDAAKGGADGGTVLWSPRADRAAAALILAPEAPLARAQTIALGLQFALIDAIGALAPPETAAVWAWPDALLVNGAVCGRMRAAASHPDPDAAPDWLVFGITVALAPLGADPGRDPGRTSLAEEGCAALASGDLIEVWARNALLRINGWMERGLEDAAELWRERAFGADLGQTRLRYPGAEGPVEGVFLGIDETGGLLLNGESGVHRTEFAEIFARSRLANPPRLDRADAPQEVA